MTMHRAFRVVIALLASALSSADVAAQVRDSAGTAHVRGRVLDAGTQRPITGSLVWLAGRTLHLARTDEDGAYTFPALAPGSYCIRVDTPGYDAARVCISLTAGAGLSVDLPLTARPVVMEPLVVQGRRGVTERTVDAADSAHITPLRRQLDIIGAQSAHRAAATLGALAQNARSDRTGGRRPHALYMWGSNADRGRVLLDGASLSAPLHLGALLPPVDPQVIESAAMHTAGVSPRFDGGTAYIMNFTTRPAADRARSWGELDLLAGRVGAESPIDGRGRVLVSARRVNDEIIGQLAPARFGYDYRDALARADLDLGASGGVHVTAFTTGEAVSIPRDFADDRASWQNRAATLMWRREGRAAHSLTLSASRGVADLPLLTALGGHLEATLDRFGALAERSWSVGAVNVDVGAEVEHHAFRRFASATHDPASGEEGYVECTALLPCARAATTLTSAFGELLFSPAHALSVSLGARTTYDSHTGSVHLLPRAALTWIADARHSLTLSAGRFSQPYVRTAEGTAATADGIVDIAHALHVEVGAARRSDHLLLRASAFLRQHERVEPTEAARTIPGADLSVEYALPAGTLSFAWSVSGAHERDAVSRIQHLASAGFHAQRGRWMVSTSAAYGSGLPLTTIVLDEVKTESIGATLSTHTGATRQLSSDPDYLRLDSWLGAEWRIHRGDRDISILPYVRIINALGERESLFYFQDSADLTRPPRALARVPAIPVIGVRWHF